MTGKDSDRNPLTWKDRRSIDLSEMSYQGGTIEEQLRFLALVLVWDIGEQSRIHQLCPKRNLVKKRGRRNA